MSSQSTHQKKAFTLVLAALAALIFLMPLPEARAGTLKVTWETVPAADLAGFRILYGTDGVSFPNVIDHTDPEAEFFDVTDLVVGETYYFKVQAFDDIPNYSFDSNIASATVVPWSGEAAQPVLNPALVSLSSPLFEISWDVSEYEGVTAAGVEVSTAGGSFANPNGAEWDPGNSCYASLTLLDSTSGTEMLDASLFQGPGVYQIRVVGLDDFGTIACHFSDSVELEIVTGPPPEVDPDTSTVTASPEEIPADGVSVSLITVSPLDASSALVGTGLSVTLQTTAGTLLGSVQDNGDGTYSQQLQSSLEATQAQVSAVAGGVAITQQALVSFIEDDSVDPNTSSVTATPEEIPADGASVSLITVTPRNGVSNLVGPGLSVTLQTTAGTLLGSVQDNGDGTYSQQLQSSLVATQAQVSAVADGVAITQQALVSFIGDDPVDPDTSTVTASPEEIPADGESVSQISVTPRDAASDLVGPGLSVVLQTTAGVLLGSVQDHGDGTYSQMLQSSLEITTAQVSANAGGIAITQQALVSFAGIPAMIVTGPGPGPDNPPMVRVFDPATRQPIEGLDFMAYGAERFGVNVSAGDVTGDGNIEIITGPGPGEIFGPQIRVFDPVPGNVTALHNTFYAYGTLRYGAKCATADIDGDHVDEILTSPGPGAVFGPHIRAWDFNGSNAFEAMGGVSFFAYGTMKDGANVTGGDIDGDGIDEIITGAGPGTVFGPHVRAFDYDGIELVPIAGVSFMAYNTMQYGVNVACGDIDGDGVDEIITGPGPGEVFGPHVRAFELDGDQLVPIPGVSFNAYDEITELGVNVACGDLDGDGIDEIITGPGPGEDNVDRLYSSRVRGWNYDGETLQPIDGLDFLAYEEEQQFGVRLALGPINVDHVAGPPAPGDAMAKENGEEQKAEATVASLRLK